MRMKNRGYGLAIVLGLCCRTYDDEDFQGEGGDDGGQHAGRHSTISGEHVPNQ